MNLNSLWLDLSCANYGNPNKTKDASRLTPGKRRSPLPRKALEVCLNSKIAACKQPQDDRATPTNLPPRKTQITDTKKGDRSRPFSMV
ncbi:hypothetical protein GCM10009091_25220 [Pseudomonas brenneri]|nr:hypothetical protein GCM10009091_25220 [Pseudomonas brenneri]